MATYRELLESEIKASDAFTKANFGMKVGDGFPEMVRELVNSEPLAMRLFINLAAAVLLGKQAVKDINIESGRSPDYSTAILNNIEAFETPLAMFYWGVQIGRKMERDSAAALRNMEGGQ